MKIVRRVKKRRRTTSRTPVRSRTTEPTPSVTSESECERATRETPLPDVVEQPVPLPRVAAPVKSADAPLLGLMREGDSIQLTQPLIRTVVEAVANGYDTVRITTLERLPDQRWSMSLSPDTAGYGAALDEAV